MPAATVWGSVLLNSAISALLEGSSVLAGGAPGMGGRRLKSGGITSGALVVTANSSGDFLFRPAACRRPSQPDRAVAARLNARSVGSNLISNLMAPIISGLLLLGRLGLKHIIKDGHGAQGDRQVGDIEDIPVIAEAVKVEKIRHPAIDQPVNQIVPDRPPDDEAITDRQGLAGRPPHQDPQHDSGGHGPQPPPPP